MNFKIAVALTLVILLVVFNACSYDNYPEPEPIEEVSFSVDILPIMALSCSTASCHDGTFEPNLLPELAYTELLGYVDVLDPSESFLIRSIEFQDGIIQMPPGVQLSEMDRALILKWIEKGALDD